MEAAADVVAAASAAAAACTAAAAAPAKWAGYTRSMIMLRVYPAQGREGKAKRRPVLVTPFREGPSSVAGGLPCQSKPPLTGTTVRENMMTGKTKVEERRDKKSRAFM